MPLLKSHSYSQFDIHSTSISTITKMGDKNEIPATDFYIGLSLAVSSSLFIGASYIIKKKGLLKISKQGQTRAGMGGYGYLKEWIWWAGLLSMSIGEAANFIAYAFAPASLVTPLGALSVLVSAVLSSRFLAERLNLLGKIGCLLCVLGSTVIVLHAPKEGQVESIEQLGEMMKEPGFIIYVTFIIAASLILIFCCAPKYGTTNLLIYILICSVIGSLSVMGCKGLGLALRETLSGERNAFSNWLTWFVLSSVITCIAIQMNYLNKALDIFNASVLTPIYYVFFTSFVIIASAVLFKEWGNMGLEDIMGNISGFLTVICAIFLLNAFKEWDISMSNLQTLFQRTESKSEPSVHYVDIEGACTSETRLKRAAHSRENSGTLRSGMPLRNNTEESIHNYNSF